jgi:serine/threonine protein kinase
LGELIGEGGMGEVYLAEREKEFRKRVAVKLIRPGMANLEIVRRFVIERQTLAALNHPQIVHRSTAAPLTTVCPIWWSITSTVSPSFSTATSTS